MSPHISVLKRPLESLRDSFYLEFAQHVFGNVIQQLAVSRRRAYILTGV